jgi:hypothetical protein
MGQPRDAVRTVGARKAITQRTETKGPERGHPWTRSSAQYLATPSQRGHTGRGSAVRAADLLRDDEGLSFREGSASRLRPGESFRRPLRGRRVQRQGRPFPPGGGAGRPPDVDERVRWFFRQQQLHHHRVPPERSPRNFGCVRGPQCLPANLDQPPDLAEQARDPLVCRKGSLCRVGQCPDRPDGGFPEGETCKCVCLSFEYERGVARLQVVSDRCGTVVVLSGESRARSRGRNFVC